MFSDGRGALGGLNWNHLKLSTINLCNCWRGHHFQYPMKKRYETSSNQQQEVELLKQRMKRWTSNSNPPPESRYKVARQPDNAMAAMSVGPFLLRHFPLFSLIASMKLLQLGIHWNLPYVNAFGASTGSRMSIRLRAHSKMECESRLVWSRVGGWQTPNWLPGWLP